MQEGAKKRLAGAVVMITVTVVFVPMLFEDESPAPPYVQGPLPPEPVFQDPLSLDAPYAVPGTPPMPAEAGGLTDEEAQLTPPEPMRDFGRIDEAFAEDGPDVITFDPVSEPAPPTVPQPRTPPPAPPPASRMAQAPTPKPAQPPKPAQQPAPKPESRVALPEPPKSRADGLPSWVVQVSSLGSPEAAGKLAGKLKQSGFSAFVEQAVVNGKTYYRVRVGPDIDRTNAERTAEMLRKQQKLDTLIQRYQ